MKSIDINKKQKEMLLEMCNKLFPEYKEIILEIEDNYEGSKDFIQFTKINPNYGDTIYIHWFEFCWTLLNKILESNLSPIKDSETIKEFGLICFNQFESLHPVDYLYEEFKKLK